MVSNVWNRIYQPTRKPDEKVCPLSLSFPFFFFVVSLFHFQFHMYLNKYTVLKLFWCLFTRCIRHWKRTSKLKRLLATQIYVAKTWKQIQIFRWVIANWKKYTLDSKAIRQCGFFFCLNSFSIFFLLLLFIFCIFFNVDTRQPVFWEQTASTKQSC